jgi:hypothetical protein
MRSWVEGYEALTRFADGTPPDVEFAEATRVGRTIERPGVPVSAISPSRSPASWCR